MAYAKLDEDDLNKAITETKEAIQRGRKLLKVVSEKPTTKGRKDVQNPRRSSSINWSVT